VLRLLFEIWESLLIALRSIRVNKLRAILTTIGIVIGITSVTGMVTIMNGIERDFEQELATLGADVLYIEQWPWATSPGFDWWNYINRPPITDRVVEPIQERSRYAVAITPVVGTGRPVRYGSGTIPNVRIEGSSPSYEQVHAVSLQDGRFYNELDDRTARTVAVIGSGVAEQLSPFGTIVGKSIRIGGRPFTVIGVMESTGQGSDNQIKIPYNTFKSLYGTSQRDVSIRVKITSPDNFFAAQDELTGILRAARGLEATEEDDFVINSQQDLREQIAPVKAAIFGIGIGLTALSLLVGGIGVMNIMFVSVKERTREIGIRKSVGAKRRNILIQFLIEAVIICLIGGSIAIGFSFGLTALLSMVMPAYLPFGTVAMAFGICVLIGIVFGIAPAYNAAKAEPIQALRYE
jgi:putative ABC transport system permease protein